MAAAVSPPPTEARSERLARVPVQIDFGVEIESKEREKILAQIRAWERQQRAPFSRTALAILRALYLGVNYRASHFGGTGFRSHKTLAHDAGIGARVDDLREPDPEKRGQLASKEAERARRIYMRGFCEIESAYLVSRERINPRDPRLDRCPHKARAVLKGRRWALPPKGVCRCPWFHGATRWTLPATTLAELVDKAQEHARREGMRLQRPKTRKPAWRVGQIKRREAHTDVTSVADSSHVRTERLKSGSHKTQVTSISVSTSVARSEERSSPPRLGGDLVAESRAATPPGTDASALRADEVTRGTSPRDESTEGGRVTFGPESTQSSVGTDTTKREPLAYGVLQFYRKVFAKSFLDTKPMPGELAEIEARLAEGFDASHLMMAIAYAPRSRWNATPERRTLHALMQPETIRALCHAADAANVPAPSATRNADVAGGSGGLQAQVERGYEAARREDEVEDEKKAITKAQRAVTGAWVPRIVPSGKNARQAEIDRLESKMRATLRDFSKVLGDPEQTAALEERMTELREDLRALKGGDES